MWAVHAPSATSHAEPCAQSVEPPQRFRHVVDGAFGARQAIGRVVAVFLHQRVDETEVANGTLARGQHVQGVRLACLGRG
jgi:hypothetical protein